jgi:hypothetical protein
VLAGSAAASRRAASAYLRQLLLKPGGYRQAWEQHVIRARRDAINQLAVAEVLARHLWSAPRSLADIGVLPYQLKDTVSRALSGQMLSRPSLSLFIGAFGFSEDESDRLWRLWSGSAMISVLAGSHAVPPREERSLARILGPRRHQTLSMHDHVHVGAEGRLERTRTIQVIEAIAAGVDRFPFLYDTSALTVEVGQGCRGLSGELRQVGPDVFATEIMLAKTLELGDTITMEYWVTYRLPGDLTDPREREYRRGVLRHMENYDMRIEFNPARLPAHLWRASWDGVEGEVTEEQEVTLDSQHAAQRYLRSLERTVAGFRWSW